jgi:hypothetical protein
MGYASLEEYNSFKNEIINIKSKLAVDFPILTKGDNSQTVLEALTIIKNEKTLPEYSYLSPTCDELYLLAQVACLSLYPDLGDGYYECEFAAFTAYIACTGA